MLGYSKTRNVIFTLTEKPSREVAPKIEVDTKLLRLDKVAPPQWKQIKQFYGQIVASYLKWRYGSPGTHVLMAYADEKLVYVEWVVPASKIRSRYPFVSNGSYSIISCLTSQDFRGLGIYPSQIQKVVASDISAKRFWIWSAVTNTASLCGIRKAGGVKVGEFVQRKWFWGCLSRAKYFPE